jgi:hypothetical protein
MPRWREGGSNVRSVVRINTPCPPHESHIVGNASARTDLQPSLGPLTAIAALPLRSGRGTPQIAAHSRGAPHALWVGGAAVCWCGRAFTSRYPPPAVWGCSRACMNGCGRAIASTHPTPHTPFREVSAQWLNGGQRSSGRALLHSVTGCGCEGVVRGVGVRECTWVWVWVWVGGRRASYTHYMMAALCAYWR